MAPMTKHHALISFPQGKPQMAAQQTRDVSWNFAGSESHSEREASEEPAASHEAEMEEDEDPEDLTSRQQPVAKTPEDAEAILHPLREAANRVGREVERFAEVLDGYNPQRATEDEERHEMMIGLIDLYHEIAVETVENLRKVHGSERQKKNGMRWRKKMRGFSVEQDDDVDMQDTDSILPSPPEDTKTKLEDLERWEQEVQTWDLLRRLVQLRFPEPDTKGQSLQDYHPINQYSTEHELWEDFLGKDELALERKTVLRWLKDSAEESGEDIDVLVHDLQQNADRGDMIAHGWIHTKGAIKSKRMNPLLNRNVPEDLITQLDPDAMTRQGKCLQKQDEYFERAIWLGCYELLRRGKSADEIREWCVERTEVWRAVSMSGFPDESPHDEDPGNPESSALWRRMCFALARNGGGDPYKKAVYGILSGDIDSVEAVCRSWDDFVFANYNALLRNQFDNYLRNVRPFSNATSNFESFDAIQFHSPSDPKSAGRRLIETLKAKRETAAETLQPMKMLQGVLIADTFSNFIYQQGLALSKAANKLEPSNLFPATSKSPEDEESTKYVTLNDHDSLRVLAHVLIIFMGLGLDLGGAANVTEVENVIVAYISFLRLSGKEELIPLYCSQLSGKRKYAILCRNLIDVTDYNQRVTQIRLMRELGLDAQEFVSLQARFLQSDYPDRTTGYPAANFRLFSQSSADGHSRKLTQPLHNFFGPDPEAVDRIDMLLIRSLEWYLLVDGLWSETFTLGTMLYMRFFKNMRLNAARSMSISVEYKNVVEVKTRAILGDTYDYIGLENEEDEDITEVLDGSADGKRHLKKYMVAQAKSFRELESLIDSLDYLETCTSLRVLLSERNDPAWQKEYKRRLHVAVEGTIAGFEHLLKGWLVTCQNEDFEEEFQNLREAYLPEMILAYLSVLQYCGGALSRQHLMTCMDISTVIAEEDSDLLALFVKTGKIQELVDKLAAASKDLLLLTASRPNQGSRSKKLKMKGWTPDLWTVKP
ncbi:uncharacterized protein L3040_002958 [Drepanopeziza brunnea f. sp. 'multigermtubi']|uniref:uncharacterized protein n=1 Tax=Drepanopeziza brunnea f. sp. 'multigermtubi' TaxID=698441 RepID=UPI002390F1A3|nr:hypothetical protein L3040_002958 [Drepanopeziza brunnea f. sp. 'multigermtubi']